MQDTIYLKRDTRLRINVEFCLFVLLLGVAFFIRIAQINYNTVFVDEAMYITIGEDALSGVFTQHATSWMFGSYFYPLLAAMLNHLVGLSGLRILSAALSTLATGLVFFVTSRLFGKQSALWSMLMFGLPGVSINLGQFAVYDALALPLLALALFFLVESASRSDKNETAYLIAASVSFGLAVLAKYSALLYLPTLTLTTLVLYLSQGKSIRPMFTTFLWLVLLILGAYTLFYSHDLAILVTSAHAAQPRDRWTVVQNLWEEIGVVILLALVGTLLLLRWLFERQEERRWRRLLLAALLVPLLALCYLVAPVYHLVAGDIQAMWKHDVYTLIFLSPLAGYGVATLIEQIRSYHGRGATYSRVAGATVTIIALVWCINYALGRNWGWQHSWPNVTGVIEYMRSLPLTRESRILAEGSATYEYYFDFGPGGRAVWRNTWFMDYHGLSGVDAMKAAILDRALDLVVLDGYYTPEITKDLEETLHRAGYTIGYEDSQQLSFGDAITTHVYVRSK